METSSATTAAVASGATLNVEAEDGPTSTQLAGVGHARDIGRESGEKDGLPSLPMKCEASLSESESLMLKASCISGGSSHRLDLKDWSVLVSPNRAVKRCSACRGREHQTSTFHIYQKTANITVSNARGSGARWHPTNGRERTARTSHSEPRPAPT